MKLNGRMVSFLAGKHIGKLATLNGDGSPQLTPVCYIYNRSKIIANIAAGRVKHGNILREPRVVLLVDNG